MKGGCIMVKQDRKTRAAEEIWLLYYNQYLYERGIISKPVYLQMQSRIRAAKAQL